MAQAEAAASFGRRRTSPGPSIPKLNVSGEERQFSDLKKNARLFMNAGEIAVCLAFAIALLITGAVHDVTPSDLRLNGLLDVPRELSVVFHGRDGLLNAYEYISPRRFRPMKTSGNWALSAHGDRQYHRFAAGAVDLWCWFDARLRGLDTVYSLSFGRHDDVGRINALLCCLFTM